MIDNNRNLPRICLQIIAAMGWILVLYLLFNLVNDSWRRAVLAIITLQQGIPEIDPFNQRYIDHPWMTLLHTVPGILFVILGPMQFIPAIRQNAARIHRISGRIYLLVVLISGTTAIAIVFVFPIWGMLANRFLMAALGTWMVLSVCKAFIHARGRRFEQHREWMIRGFTAGLAIGLFRLVLDDILLPRGFLLTTAWNWSIAVSLPIAVMAGEFWIWATRPGNRRVDA